MGHADIKILLDVYTHLDKQKSSSKDKMNSYFAVWLNIFFNILR